MPISIDYFEDLTTAEKKALKQMDKAMKTLSKRHWFYVAGGDLNLIRRDVDNYIGDSVNHEAVAVKITGYCVDGGDW